MAARRGAVVGEMDADARLSADLKRFGDSTLAAEGALSVVAAEMGHVDAPSLTGRRAQLHHLARVAPRVREVGETGRESNGALLDTLLDEPLRLLQRRPQ